MRRRFAALTAVVAVVGATAMIAFGLSGVTGTATPAAKADSGYCAVRVDGPSWTGGSVFIYHYRNRCGRWIHTAVRLPYYGGATIGCQWVGPYDNAYVASTRVDPNWYVVNC